jgi:predicted phage tail protein
MLRKVKLYGELADFVGYKELDAVINSTADAIRFLVSNFPKLEGHMNERYYKVLVNDYEIGEEDIQNPTGQSDINIVPVITGAGGAGKFLLGAALIAGAFLVPGSPLIFGKGFATSLAGAGFGFKAAIGIGGALVLQGVSELLFPLPDLPDFSNEEDPRISFSFSGVQNTSRAGTSHPIVYGEIVTGSVVISAGIDTNQVSA